MLSLLETAASRDDPATLAELTAAMNLPKATVHRLIGQLVDFGYLERTLDGKRFAVGARFAKLAAGALRGTISRGPRRAILRGLVDQLGETCNITVLDGDELVYLDRAEAAWPLQVRLTVGSRVPLHCTASGKLFLALAPDRILRAFLSAGALRRHTPRTLVTPEALLEALARIREDGFGTDEGEFIEGMTAVAVPVTDRSRRIVATIAAHGPATRLPLSLAIRHVPTLRAAAEKIGALIRSGVG